MKPPEKAIILCAGFGTRMQPLTNLTPKPLLPLWGRPALDHLCAMLAKWGVRQVLINLHHQSGELLQHFRTHNFPGLRINLSFESSILGTGGALSQAAWFLPSSPSEPFWLINGDIAADVSPRPFLCAFARSKPLSVLWMTGKSGPKTVEVNNGRIQSFHTKQPGRPQTYTFCGLHLLSSRILDYIPERCESSIITAYEAAQKAGHSVLGVCPDRSFWADLGTPAGYIAAHAAVAQAAEKRLPGASLMTNLCLSSSALRRAGIKAEGTVAVAKSARIAAGTGIEDSIVLDDCRISTPAVLHNAIVSPGVALAGSGLTVDAVTVPLRVMNSPELMASAAHLKFDPDSSAVIQFPPRGSARKFFRLCCGSASAIVIIYDPQRQENCLYVQNAGLLKRAGINVPETLMNRPDILTIAVEDVGSTDLLSVVRAAGRHAVIRTYNAVIQQVLRMHEEGTRLLKRSKIKLSEPFSPQLYKWERTLFCEKFLDGYLHLDAALIAKVEKELEAVAGRLVNEPQVLIHRDLQSSNILIHKSIPVFIDFQGMRPGSALYDLASLLCDPYVSLPQETQTVLLKTYAESAEQTGPAFHQLFWWAAVQRLSQALGAYGRLASNPGTRSFERHIVPALRMLDRALDFTDYLKTTKEVVCRAEERLSQ